jgi:hypothetical protein
LTEQTDNNFPAIFNLVMKAVAILFILSQIPKETNEKCKTGETEMSFQIIIFLHFNYLRFVT